MGRVSKNQLFVDDVTYDEEKGIRLGKGLYWNFDQDPHLLIEGRTMSGKTILLLDLLKVLPTFATVDLCDAENYDLALLGRFEVFKDHVFSEKEGILSCLRKNVELIESRYEQMMSCSDLKVGEDYKACGFAPHFILLDGWIEFLFSLGCRTLQAEDLLAQLVLKGRQAGVFVILTAKRADLKYLGGVVRENMLARIALGKISDVGYHMLFGVEKEENEIQYFPKAVGQGYASLAGGKPIEFYAPYVPFDKGYSFEAVFAAMNSLKKLL